MFKKLGIVALVLVAGFFLLRHTDVGRFAKLRLNQAKSSLRDAVKPEDKIAILKTELANLNPETHKNREIIASEMVEIEKLTKHIKEARANLAQKEGQIRDLRAELKSANTTFVSIAGERIPRNKVEQSLTRQWDAFKQAEEAVKSQEDLLNARKDSLEVAKQRLAAMENKREELQAKVQKLELELGKLRLAQTKNDIPFDDSQLSNVMRLVDEVETQINKEKTVIAMEKAVFTDNVVEKAMEQKAKTDKALKEMDDRFTGENKMALEKK